ncbi:MAG: site-specific integrase [Jiangellaceae bacterium]
MTEPKKRGRPKAAPIRTKRANGEDSCFADRERPGKWIATGMVVGLGRRKVRGDSESEAWAKLDQLRRDNVRFDLRSTVPTVAQLAEEWLANYSLARAAASTISTRTQRIRTHIVDDRVIGPMRVSDLQPAHVETWLRTKIRDGYLVAGRRKPYAATTIRDLRQDLQQIVGWALTRRTKGLDWNPVAHIDKFKIEEESPLKRSLTETQALALVVEAAGTSRRYGALLLGCLLLGCRPGEMAGLRWDRIDFDTGEVRIDTALQRRSGGTPLKLGPTKTRQSRTLVAPTILLDALTAERKRQDEARHPEWPKEWEGLVFLGRTGVPPGASNLRRELRRIVADAGLPDEVLDLDPYELRHTCASLLDQHGVPVSDIINQLGHADDRMFFKHYRHKTDPISGRPAAAMWEQWLDEGPG